MILAAAMKIHIESTNSDVVLCAARHGNIGIQLKLLGFEPNKGYKILVQGFINHKGKFLSRSDAFIHARECGQISSFIVEQRLNQTTNGDYELFSEDLW